MRSLVVAITLAVPAFAVTPGDERCADPNFRISEIKTIGEAHARIASAIESVPPSEAAYIQAETSAALRDHNEARFNIAVSNRFYYPLQVHTHDKSIKETIEAAGREKSPKQQVIYLSAVLATTVDFKYAVSECIDFDQRRTPRIVIYDRTPRRTSPFEGRHDSLRLWIRRRGWVSRGSSISMNGIGRWPSPATR